MPVCPLHRHLPVLKSDLIVGLKMRCNATLGLKIPKRTFLQNVIKLLKRNFQDVVLLEARGPSLNRNEKNVADKFYFIQK